MMRIIPSIEVTALAFCLIFSNFLIVASFVSTHKSSRVFLPLKWCDRSHPCTPGTNVALFSRSPRPPKGKPPIFENIKVDPNSLPSFFSNLINRGKTGEDEYYEISGGDGQYQYEDSKEEKNVEEDVTKDIKIFVKRLGSQLLNEILIPIFGREIEKGVSPEVIKGAAISAAVASVLTSKGVDMISAAILSASYLSITPGSPGKVVRSIGDITWTATERFLMLYTEMNVASTISSDKKVAQPTPNTLEKVVVEEVTAKKDEIPQQMEDEAEIVEQEEKHSEEKKENTVVEDVSISENSKLYKGMDITSPDEEINELVASADKVVAEVEAMIEKKEEEQMREMKVIIKAAAEEKVRLKMEAIYSSYRKAAQPAPDTLKMVVEGETTLKNGEVSQQVEDDAEIVEQEENCLKEEEENTVVEEENMSVEEDVASTDVKINDMVTNTDKALAEVEAIIKKTNEEEAMREMEEKAKAAEAAEIVLRMQTMVKEEENRLDNKARAAKKTKKEQNVNILEEKVSDPVSEIQGETKSPELINYDTLTVVKLKDILRDRGFKVSGKKAELIKRLESSE